MPICNQKCRIGRFYRIDIGNTCLMPIWHQKCRFDTKSFDSELLISERHKARRAGTNSERNVSNQHVCCWIDTREQLPVSNRRFRCQIVHRVQLALVYCASLKKKYQRKNKNSVFKWTMSAKIYVKFNNCIWIDTRKNLISRE